MEPPPVGSLVVPSPRYRQALDAGEGAALLLALRRGSGKLFYAAADRTYWVPMNEIRPIPATAVPPDCLERLLSDLLQFLEAEECSVEKYGDRAMELAIEAPALSREQLRELEGWIGDHLDGIDFGPRNMSLMMLRLRLLSLPEAAPTGT